MPTPRKIHRIKLTRPEHSQGGFSSGRTEHKICEWPASEKLPENAVRVADDTELTGWKAGAGPAPLSDEATDKTNSEEAGN